jgi:hypothetical protein
LAGNADDPGRKPAHILGNAAHPIVTATLLRTAALRDQNDGGWVMHAGPREMNVLVRYLNGEIGAGTQQTMNQSARGA